MRKNYFVNEDSGFFIKQQKRQANVKMPMNGLYIYKLIISESSYLLILAAKVYV
jgi:hypothetical protein